MKTSALTILLCATLGIVSAEENAVLLTVTVVPYRSVGEPRAIPVAGEKPDAFYVILTNTSSHPVSLWETWCSWGYWMLAFELTGPDGTVYSIVKTPTAMWTMNFPASYSIPPGEQQVIPVRLDKEWINRPNFPETHTPVTFKAVYEIHESKESKQHNVWSGRIESKAYSFTATRP